MLAVKLRDRIPAAGSAIATALAVVIGPTFAPGGYLQSGFVVVIVLVAAISMVWPERLGVHLVAGVVPALALVATVIAMSDSSNRILGVVVWTVELGLPAVVGAVAGRRLTTRLRAKHS
jgi:hypothetical protein